MRFSAMTASGAAGQQGFGGNCASVGERQR